LECALVSFDGGPSHAHLAIEHPPKISVAVIAGGLKGTSSRLLYRDRVDRMPARVESALWEPGYLATSDVMSDELIEWYVEDGRILEDGEEENPPSLPTSSEARPTE
jgi:REP element-mobilizing transposase RayT